ncbi:MAG: hypothetical protein CL730_00955 [Chloroflexi bacterium]|nr:hypothetical protein [Chloroflexota bacterium]|tara:strand:- start:267 stop:1052 length:786 start_codon:yes stop_codon:yes gene_type:complete
MSHTVVIPCAGKGTRLYPMTKNTSKSMLDLGNFKIIDYAISESLMSGATKIILIISPGDLKLKKHINNIYNSNKLPFVQDINKFTIDFIMVEQITPKGLGDAINLAKVHISENHFGIILPDDFIFSTNPILKNMREVSLNLKSNILLGKKISKDLVSNFGIIELSDYKNSSYRKVACLKEKPHPNNTQSNISILGRYYLSTKIFDYLDILNPGHGGEIQLTDALVELLKSENFYVIDSQSIHFDVGSKEGYNDANNYLSQL